MSLLITRTSTQEQPSAQFALWVPLSEHNRNVQHHVEQEARHLVHCPHVPRPSPAAAATAKKRTPQARRARSTPETLSSEHAEELMQHGQQRSHQGRCNSTPEPPSAMPKNAQHQASNVSGSREASIISEGEVSTMSRIRRSRRTTPLAQTRNKSSSQYLLYRWGHPQR